MYPPCASQHVLQASHLVVVLPVLGELQHQQQIMLHLRTTQLPGQLLLLVWLQLHAAKTGGSTVLAAVFGSALPEQACFSRQLLSCLCQEVHTVTVQSCQQRHLTLAPR